VFSCRKGFYCLFLKRKYMGFFKIILLRGELYGMETRGSEAANEVFCKLTVLRLPGSLN